MPVSPAQIATIRNQKFVRIAVDAISKTAEILLTIPPLASGAIRVPSMGGQRVP